MDKIDHTDANFITTSPQVLDFLPNGYPFDTRPSHKKTPIAQVLGTRRFSLLEVVPKRDIHLNLSDKIYLGEGKRDQVHHINGKVDYDKLTNTARSNLEISIKELIHKTQDPYLEFFNKAQPLSTRMHAIELLPGIGKKHMWEILDERRDGDFKSFDDIRERVKLIPDPENLILKRILREISEPEKHLLFVNK